MKRTNDGVTKLNGVLALLFFASVAVAQNPQAPVARSLATQAPIAAPEAPAHTAPAPSTSVRTPAGHLEITYIGGQLRIDALDSTLKDVLTKLAALTGMTIDIPAGASSEHLPVVKFGPGPAREVLASLLTGSNFDYLIQAPVTDPEGIQDVVLMPREKKGSGGNAPDPAARHTSSPSVTALVSPSRPEEIPEPNSPVSLQPDNSTTAANSSTPVPTEPDPSAASPSAPSPSALSPAALVNRSGLTSEGAVSTPATLDPQSINQQLQQMYQQRIQINQQDRPSAPPSPSAPANPGSK